MPKFAVIVKWVYRIIRFLFVTAIVLLLGIPMALYLLLSLPSVQNYAAHEAEKALTELLDANIVIGRVNIAPFNQITLHDVSITPRDSLLASRGPAAIISKLGAGINFTASLRREALVINYVELMGMAASIWRETPQSPLNIDPIIKALQPKDKTKPPTQFNLAINRVVLRQCAVSYDVWSAPRKPADRFDPNHIAMRDIRTDIHIPRLANDDFIVEVNKLRARELSGIDVTFDVKFAADNSHISAHDLTLELSNSLLDFGPIDIPINSLSTAAEDIKTAPLHLTLLDNSHVTLSDLAPFVPQLAKSPLQADLSADISGTLNSITLNSLSVGVPDAATSIHLEGTLSDLLKGTDHLAADLSTIRCHTDGQRLKTALQSLVKLSPTLTSLLDGAGDAVIDGNASYSASHSAASLSVSSAIARMKITADASGKLLPSAIQSRHVSLKSDVDIEHCDLSTLKLSRHIPTHISGNASIAASVSGNRIKAADARIELSSLRWHGTDYPDLHLACTFDGQHAETSFTSRSDALMAHIRAKANVGRKFSDLTDLSAYIDIDNFDLAALDVPQNWHGTKVSLLGTISSSTVNINNMDADVDFSRLHVTRADGEMVDFGTLHSTARNSSMPMRSTLASEIIDAQIEGSYNFAAIVADGRNIFARCFPALTSEVNYKELPGANVNDFSLNIQIKSTEKLAKLFKLPVEVITPVTVQGNLDAVNGTFALALNAPYLLQKGKVIEGTTAQIDLNAAADTISYNFATLMPTKKGSAALSLKGSGGNDSLGCLLGWNVNGSRQLDGTLDLIAHFSRSVEGALCTDVDIHHSDMMINGTPWEIHPASLSVAPRCVNISRWEIGNADQHIVISGTASDNPEDIATVELSNIDLDYLFDTLNINHVDFGGIASGTAVATGAFSTNPVAYIDDLYVKNLSYNGCVFGDAHIASGWDNTEQAVTLDADIHGDDGSHTTVKGGIWPLKDGGRLDLTFGANHSPVGFLVPFMEAFASNVTGHVTGSARLAGTFSDLDLEGSAKAENFGVTLPFTNTTYYVTDSVTFTPGNIVLPPMTITDVYGNKATFSGWLKHRYFHDPEFEFSLTNAESLLCYDIADNDEQAWYGRIFADGSASVKGRPGVVDIDINVATAPHSTFGFKLTDSRIAGEYTFITFRDKDGSSTLSAEEQLVPEVVRDIRRKAADKQEEGSSEFNISIGVDANPNVAVTLVMDPIAGDKIKATGSGPLRMTYRSRSDELQIYGTYTLDRGTYNFSLQDIIFKDFTIDPGSSISFHGNPYGALLDITAAYQTTANLADIDEAFKEDKDLNRTTVPVRALMKITGNMRQPDLAFDLDFPTLTSDIDRKIRSLVNTEEMLNRQVIYLLALNRFYTPNYNATATHSNEFTSLATNTLSSRLSSLLGSISDNWTIAPAVRSDLGDFSDMEVDLALSSHLLNNRLLINGNLGYRDKSLNSTSFVGDFDIEYLLNKSGTIRLKAYNRFNDQTFYVKNALTTQGVGLKFTRDFDDFGSWVKQLLRLKPKVSSTGTE